MKIDGQTIVLILSILGLMATLFLTKLGSDMRKNRIKRQRTTLKQRIFYAVQKRWKLRKEQNHV